MKTIHSKPFSIEHSSPYMNSCLPRLEVTVKQLDCYALIERHYINVLNAREGASRAMRDEPNLKGNCAVYSACELTLHGFWLEGIRHSGVDNLLVNLRKQKAEVQLKLDNRNSNLAAGEERLLNYSNPILKPPDF